MTNQKKPHGCIVAFQRFFTACLAIAATFFLLINLFYLGIKIKVEGISLMVVAVSGFFVLRFLWKKVGRTSRSNKDVFKNIFFDLVRTIAVFLLFSVIMTILVENTEFIEDSDIPKDDETKTEIVTTTEGDEVIRYIINKQYWRDFDGDWYRMDFKIAENNVQKSKKNREGYIYTRDFTWGKFYKHMADHDKPLLEHLYTSFSKIQKEKNMSRTKFAEFIITSSQDIQ